MKKLIALLGIMTFAFTMNAQISMSVSAGMKYQKTTFGYRFGKMQPYLGFGVLSVGSTIEEVYYDGAKYTSEGSFRVIMPNFGVKYDLISKENLKAGLDLGFYKPFLSGKSVSDGEEDKFIQDELDKVKIFGGEFGVFSEYYFNKQFSIGGEFGLRFAKSNYDSEADYTIKLNMCITYTMLSANFYF